ncbi:hypothetical protein N7540_001564 [Penicillium herquei]|nr:hypothetical protein N7540_001564 [Penicillium herquei]
MEKLNTEDGQLFIKNLASFVRTHEKALANALQLRRQSNAGTPQSPTGSTSNAAGAFSSTSLASALSFGALKFASQNIKPAKLTLTPHHLFYLLSRFEDLSIAVGPMNVRLENIHTEVSQSYVSFLSKPQRSKGGDGASIHSVSSVRSVMSGMSGLWSSFGLGSKDSASKTERAKLALEADLKYLYSAFTKIPCLRLAPDHRACLIRGYEEFPFDTAVPLHSFKNLSALEIIDIDYRSFYGWDRLSEQLRTLSIKRAHLDDPMDLLTRIVLDDMDKRRRRSTKTQSPPLGWNNSSSTQPVHASDHTSISAPGSPVANTALASSTSPKSTPMIRAGSEGAKVRRARAESISPQRPTTKHGHRRGQSARIRRTGSGSSNSSDTSGGYRTGSSSTLLPGVLPPSKWRFLRHLGLPDNSLTSISAASLAPVANTLNSLDLSSNLLSEIPDSLSTLMALRALNLSHCMIDSMHSLSRNPLPAITALNLRGNRLQSLAGIERLLSLERLDLRDNNLMDPTEMARLTCLPEIREIWVTGNPFVKTHSNYRVVIMNLFRRTPGYSEDIIIDGRGPGYTERKQLVDRVAEPEAAPVIRSSAADQSVVVYKPAATVIQTKALPKPPVEADELPPVKPLVQQSDTEGTGTNRRKKIQRRRIVDLSTDNPFTTDGLGNPGPTVSPVSPTQQIHAPIQPPFVLPLDQWKQDSATQSGSSSIQSPAKHAAPSASPPLLQPTVAQPTPTKDWVLDQELCRQQLEALRGDVSHNWLTTVLGEHPWDTSQKELAAHLAGPSMDHSPLSTPAIQTNSHAILTAGHTMGG